MTDADDISWTPRQREVLDLLAKGLTNGQLADALGITLDGAKWHVSEIIAKLGVDTREEAAEYWRKQRGIRARIRAFSRRTVSPVLLRWVGFGSAAAVAAVTIPALFMASGSSQPSGEWERLPDPPLSPRTEAIGVWTGEEVIFVGGTEWTCPPAASCVGPIEPLLTDGAALDPSTETWRTIAPMPRGFVWASAAVIDTHVYLLAFDSNAVQDGMFLLDYSIAGDEWAEIPLPMTIDVRASYRLVAAREVLVVYQGTQEVNEAIDYSWDPATREWSALPEDPLGIAFDRAMVFAEGQLYLFDHELVASPNSTRPSLVRVARLDLSSMVWERLPDTGMLGGGGLFAEDGVIVIPNPGGADGGSVETWGAVYPWGGKVDTATGEWSPLPPGPSMNPRDHVEAAGVVGSDEALFFSHRGGWLLDLSNDTWIQMPALDDTFTERRVVTAGADAVVFGGAGWGIPAARDGELLGDAWIWRSGRGN